MTSQVPAANVGASPFAAAVRALADKADGLVLLPGEPGWDEEIEGFEHGVRHHPDLVVSAASAADVTLAVRFARDNGLGVAVQRTGHGASIPADGGLLITTHRMNGHSIDPERRTVTLQAGALWEDVIPAATDHGLAPLSGSAPFVGAVSYTLGGGLGLLSRRYGYAADHVRWIDVVTADGEPHRASEREHPDLFWALRGGKGNFGVVTALQMELLEVPRLYGGGLYFPAEATRDVLHAYREWVTGMPEELSSSFAMIPFPDLPIVPEPLRGRFATHVRLSHLGTASEGEALIQPLRDVARPLLDTVTEMPYRDVASIHGDLPISGSYYINTFQLTSLGEGTVDALLALGGPDSDGLIGVEVRHLGGALARPPRVPNAVTHGDAPFQLYSASVLGVGQDEAVHTAHARLRQTMAPWNSGYRTLNFMAGTAHRSAADVRSAFTEDAYRRLAHVKNEYDPGNMFRFNHNIPPADRR